MCDSCLQHDIRLERNDIIALVNTLQQVAPFPLPRQNLHWSAANHWS
jgi:hypothetical protein